MARRLDSERAPAPNWGLLLMLVLAVEFWVLVASAVTQYL